VRQVAELAFRVFGRGGSVRRAEDKQDLRTIRFPAGDAIFARIGRPPQIDLARGLSLLRDAHG
jgi:hypothetical protein